MKIGNCKNCSRIGRETPCLINDMKAHWRGEPIRVSVGVVSAECKEGALTPLTDRLCTSCYKSLTDRQFSRRITPFAKRISSDNYLN